MEKINYLIFGGLTTAVNYIVFFLISILIRTDYAYLFANGAAWTGAVAFAFVTNKLFVFKSITGSRKALLREAGAFVSARLASLLIEYGWLIFSVEALRMNEYLAKLVASVVIIAMNYFFSKMFIFNRKKNKVDTEDTNKDTDKNTDADITINMNIKNNTVTDKDKDTVKSIDANANENNSHKVINENIHEINTDLHTIDTAFFDIDTDKIDIDTVIEENYDADNTDTYNYNTVYKSDADNYDAIDNDAADNYDAVDNDDVNNYDAADSGDADIYSADNDAAEDFTFPRGFTVIAAANIPASDATDADDVATLAPTAPAGASGATGADGGAPPGWLRRNGLALLSFFMPIMLLLTSFAVIEVYPFGQNSMLIIDNHHQYTPFLIEFGNILRSGKSLLYSWTAGLGSNYVARIAYYLSSPLNFLSVFINDSSATELTLALVLIRVGAAGFAFFLYLKSKFRAQSFVTVAFAVMYSMCGYFLAYYWNIMWFDCIAVFPLVALGIERLADRGSGLLYCLTLAYTIMSNYFIAIMVCIYSALYFIAYLAGGQDSVEWDAGGRDACGRNACGSEAGGRDDRGRKSIGQEACERNAGGRKSPERRGFRYISGRIGGFILYSLIAGALSAVITLPAYFGLLRSSAAGADLPGTVRLYSNLIDIIANHLALIKPSIMVGLPNIYCGVAVLMLLPLYYLNRAISFREKVSNGLLVCFFIISFNVNTLDFLWHGTHFPNSLFFRFAFLYVFLVLTMSYHTLKHIDMSSGREVFVVFALLAGFILFMEALPAEKTTKWTIYGSFVFALTQAAALAVLIRKRREANEAQTTLSADRVNLTYQPDQASETQAMSVSNRTNRANRARLIAEIVLAALICTEIAVNAGYGIGEAGIFPKQNYLMKTGDVKPTVNLVNQLEQSDGSSGFERMEFTEHTTYNTPIIYGYKGISYYSSTSYVAVNEMFGKLGLIHSNAWYVYRSAPPTLNSMFAIRYLLSQNGAYNNGIYDEVNIEPNSAMQSPGAALQSPGGMSPATDATGAAGAVRVYENPYYLPLGFIADESILSWNLAQSNPFICQEDFYKRASGLNLPLFGRLEPKAARLENLTVTSGGGTDGLYRYRPTDVNRDIKAEYRVTARQDGPVYFYVKCANIEKVKVANLTAQTRGSPTQTRGGAAQAPEGIEKEHDIRYPYVIDAQYAREGDEVKIELIFEKPDADSFTLYACDFNQQVFGEMWNRLNSQVLNVVEYTDTRLSGEIYADAPGLLYTSIPYDEGWRVTVNGNPAEVETVGGGALIAVRLPQGKNIINFSYMTPGLVPGAAITLCAALLLIGLTLYKVYIPNMRSFKSK